MTSPCCKNTVTHNPRLNMSKRRTSFVMPRLQERHPDTCIPRHHLLFSPYFRIDSLSIYCILAYFIHPLVSTTGQYIHKAIFVRYLLSEQCRSGCRSPTGNKLKELPSRSTNAPQLSGVCCSLLESWKPGSELGSGFLEVPTTPGFSLNVSMLFCVFSGLRLVRWCSGKM